MKITKKKRAQILTSDAELRRAVRVGRRRERTATKIVAARYDRKHDSVVTALSTGATLAVPRRFILGFAKASPADLADLEIMPAREALWSNKVDDGVLLEQLLVLAGGAATLGEIGGRLNGAKKSAARAAASRANGAKGGRPRV